MGLSQEAVMWLIGFWCLLLVVGFALNELRKWLNKKLNKYGITIGKKEDDGQK